MITQEVNKSRGLNTCKQLKAQMKYAPTLKNSNKIIIMMTCLHPLIIPSKNTTTSKIKNKTNTENTPGIKLALNNTKINTTNNIEKGLFK